jgi:hypothetical protein
MQQRQFWVSLDLIGLYTAVVTAISAATTRIKDDREETNGMQN